MIPGKLDDEHSAKHQISEEMKTEDVDDPVVIRTSIQSPVQNKNKTEKKVNLVQRSHEPGPVKNSFTVDNQQSRSQNQAANEDELAISAKLPAN